MGADPARQWVYSLIAKLLARVLRRRSQTRYPLLVRLTYRTVRPLARYSTWALRRLAYRMGKRGSRAPRVGIHTVFIARENILFLKEWVLYHKYMGVEHFFLYDNSGADIGKADTARRPIGPLRAE